MKKMQEAKAHLLEATDLLEQAIELNTAVLNGDISEKAAVAPAARFVEQAIDESHIAKETLVSPANES